MLKLRNVFDRTIGRAQPNRSPADSPPPARPSQPLRPLEGVTTENEEHYRGAPYSISIPNFNLRAASSTGELGYWYAIGEAWAQIASAFLPAAGRILDVGCGCGKMARFLVHDRELRYVGLDVFYPSIHWCRREFARYSDRFQFEHVDVISGLYNPEGKIRGDEVRLPVDDASVDLAICGSLFTHLLEPTFRHYLSELRRCLKPSGIALVSLHTNPADGRFSGSEQRIDVSEACFEDFAAAAGLRTSVRIGNVYGQEVCTIARTDNPDGAARASAPTAGA